MIDIENLSVQFGGRYLFSDVNIRIGKSDKIALVGLNGTGKSTFLKILIGIEEFETGRINRQKGITIGYLPQEYVVKNTKNLFDEVKSGLDSINTLIAEEKEILSALENNDKNNHDNLLDRLGEIHHQKERIDFYRIDSEIEKILVGLGFKESDFQKQTQTFSGGWQMRIALAKILISNPDLILLDEPTNHLDFDSLRWLKDYLKQVLSSIIIISHDQYFISEITTKTLEIYNNNLSFFNGKYLDYISFKEEREKTLLSQQIQQQKKIKEVERFIERFRYKATKAKQVQSRIKQLEKIDLIEVEDSNKQIKILFPDPPKSGIVTMELVNIKKSYGPNVVFDNANLTLERNDKIAIVGVNGAGKSTLVKILANEIDFDSGERKLGYNTILSYFSQEVADNLPKDLSIIDALIDINEEITVSKLRSILGSFLFSDDDVFKLIKVLSGGEKSRVALAKILLTKSNLIILDEPTNHLDVNSKKMLSLALQSFSGSLVIVSHDIDFIRPIANKIIEVHDKRIKIYPGDIDYFISKKDEEKFKEISITSEDIPKKSFSLKEQKRKEAELRQKKFESTKEIKNKISQIESDISEIENSKDKIEKELLDEKVYLNGEILREKQIEYNHIKNQLEIKLDLWAELSDQLNSIEASFDQL